MCGAAVSTEYRAGGVAIGGRYVQSARSTKAPFTTLHEINQLVWHLQSILGVLPTCERVKIVTSLGMNFQEQDDLPDEDRVPPARCLGEINPR